MVFSLKDALADGPGVLSVGGRGISVLKGVASEETFSGPGVRYDGPSSKLYLYLRTPTVASAVAYGKNALNLEVEDGGGLREATVNFELKDFSLFSLEAGSANGLTTGGGRVRAEDGSELVWGVVPLFTH